MWDENLIQFDRCECVYSAHAHELRGIDENEISMYSLFICIGIIAFA